MNTKKVKRLWPFKFYDFELINKYLNDKADQGEALEYIGTVLATYIKGRPREYTYCVDFIENCDVTSEEFEIYKKTWIDENWEYVDFCDGIIIFRCKKQDKCIQPYINLEKVREDIFSQIKKEGKSDWLQAAMWILLAGFNIFLNDTTFKIVWLLIAFIHFLRFDSFISYLNIKRGYQSDFLYSNDQLMIKKNIRKVYILRSMKKFLASILFILLLYMLIYYYKSSFAAKCAIVGSVIIVGCIVYKTVKQKNESRKNKFNFESAKGKFLLISIGMFVTIAVIVSFVMIDQSKPKKDIIKDIPNVILECNNKNHYVNHDLGTWRYEYTNGISLGSEEEFRLPKLEEIVNIDKGNDSTIDISFLNEPDKKEIRYWNKDDFNKLTSYNKGYKKIQIENNTFSSSEEDVVYVLYAEWKKEFYEGAGYYLFTVGR